MTAAVWPIHVTITGLPSGLSAHPAVIAVEALLLAYFVAVNVVDFVAIGIALRTLGRSIRLEEADPLETIVTPFAPPVSVIVPVVDEASMVSEVVRSLLRLEYHAYEVIVVNDGSNDATLDVLVKDFALVRMAHVPVGRLHTTPVRGVYRSLRFPQLHVVDKENGGKGDALNAGLNQARYPLVFTGDGDSLYTRDALTRLVRPFIDDPATVACGSSLRILNEAELVDGTPVRRGLPRNVLVRFQILEYLRSALASRAGWAPINGLMTISGACGMWRKDVVLAAGAFSNDTIWEDMEMTVRLHHYLRAAGRKYRIAFVPAAVCWTNVPETLGALQAQRIGWQRHITETITRHRRLLFSRFGGIVGWYAFPSIVLTEWVAPLCLLVGLAFVIAAGFLGILSMRAQLALLALVFSLTLVRTASAFVLDEASYATFSLRSMWRLFLASVLELFGYRQLVALWSLCGIWRFYAHAPIPRRTTPRMRWNDPPWDYRPRR